MPYPPAFLAIRLAFARRMAALSGQPIHEAILRRTALYRILRLVAAFYSFYGIDDRSG